MSNGSTQAKMYDFMYGKYLLETLFGIDMQEDDYVEMAYGVWRDIGNIATSLHAIDAVTDTDGYVELPCNCEFVESVSGGHQYREDGNILVQYAYGSPVTLGTNHYFPDAIQNDIYLTGPTAYSELHADGQYLDYELMNRNGGK